MKQCRPFIVMLGFLGLLCLTGCRASHETQEPPHRYQVSQPLVKDVTLNDEYVCQIRSIQHIELRSLEKGYLQKIYVDEGQVVHEGQTLFQIKPRIYQADVEKAQAEVDLASIELSNNQALVEKDIISKTEAVMSAAKLAKAQAELELSEAHLGFTEVKAPFSGIIGRFGDVRTGSLLDEGDLLTTLSDNHRMWVYFNVPEAKYLSYMAEKGQHTLPKVQLALANGKLYPQAGVIETIASDFSNTSGNIAFRATFSNPKALLRHGQTGEVLWAKVVKNAVIIPQKSTFEVLDKKFVLVVDKQGLVHEREIEVAAEAPNIYIIKSGIKPSEMYLLEKHSKVYKGDKIQYTLIAPERVMTHLDLYAN